VEYLFSIALALLFLVASGQGMAAVPSEKELAPFCHNAEIWQELNIRPGQCMKASLACAGELEKRNVNWIKASEAFYPCVFKQLGIKLDKQP